jgi:hypothetical protein
MASPSGAAALDPPVLTAGAAGHGKVVLSVSAGSSGAPAGFAVWWMKRSDYMARGGLWFPEGTSPLQGEAHFTGNPSLSTFGGTTTDYRLAPASAARVAIGELLDETGVSTNNRVELGMGTAYVFTAFAVAGGASSQSLPAPPIVRITRGDADCTRPVGWWRENPDKWPFDAFGLTPSSARPPVAASRARPAAVAGSTLPLGTQSYSRSDVTQILNRASGIGEPDLSTPDPGMSLAATAGNGLIALAHQLIAARCNQYSGATVPAPILATMADADALIGSLVVPPVGDGYLDPAVIAPDWQILSDYNHGLTGPNACLTTPARPSTWGSLKRTYR